MYKALFNKELKYDKIKKVNEDIKEDVEKLYEIRKIRNTLAGHSISSEYGKKSVRIGFNDDIVMIKDKKCEFLYWLYVDNKTDAKTKVETGKENLCNLYEIQEKAIGNLLDNILKKMKEEENKYRESFRNEKLANILKKNTLFDIRMIKEISPEIDKNMGEYALKHFKDKIKKVKEALKKRYGESLKGDGLVLEIEKIDYILNKFDKDKENIFSINLIDWRIYIEALEKSFKELKEMLKEIDKSFEEKV